MSEHFINLESLKINSIMPCFAMPEKIRFITLVNQDISPVFPYLNAVIDDAIFNKEGLTIMFNKEHRRISLFPNKIAGAKIDDSPDAHDILKWVVDLMNDCWKRKDEIEPNYDRRMKLGVLDILKLLPGTNCKQCGYPTCLAFAAMVAQQKVVIDNCNEIFKPEYTEKRKLLGELLKLAGYSISTFFT